MSGKLLQPPLPKKAGRTPKPVRAARRVEQVGRRALIERRDRCIAMIARLPGEEIATGSLPHKARQLLTRHWAASAWRNRSDILRSAEWLLGIGQRREDDCDVNPIDAEAIHFGPDRSRNTRDKVGGAFP